jgi:aspartate racemase
MSKKPLLGIIGGMGTAAGLHFQNLLFQLCNAKGTQTDQDYPEWIYFNASKAPDRTDALFSKTESPVKYLADVIHRLEHAGADKIIVACNTAHSFYDEISSSTNLKWINLQNETAEYLKSHNYSSAALLSTEGTLKSGLFKNAIEPLGINYFEPEIDSEMQQKVTDAIYHPEFGIKSTGSKLSREAITNLQYVVDQIDAQAIIAGCTELSLAENYLSLKADWLDPMKISAEVCFKLITA